MFLNMNSCFQLLFMFDITVAISDKTANNSKGTKALQISIVTFVPSYKYLERRVRNESYLYSRHQG